MGSWVGLDPKTCVTCTHRSRIYTALDEEPQIRKQQLGAPSPIIFYAIRMINPRSLWLNDTDLHDLSFYGQRMHFFYQICPPSKGV